MKYAVKIMMAAVLCGAAFAQQKDPKTKQDAKPAPEPAQTASAMAAPGGGAAPATADKQMPKDPKQEFVLGPQDVITVSVWHETELSAPQVQVRPDGMISLPLLHDVKAAGFTPTELESHITELLKKYVENPVVTVVVAQINSRRYFIVGEVGRQGAYPLLTQTTVLQALSEAGGFSQFANVKGVYVMRSASGKQMKMPFNYKEAVKGGSDIELQPGDTIVVP